MKFLPKTTFSQIASILTLLLLFNLLISFLVLRWLVINPGAEQFAEMIDNQAELLEIQLSNDSADQANTWLTQHIPEANFHIKTDISKLEALPDIHFYRAIQQKSSALSNATEIVRISQTLDGSWLWLKSTWMQGYALGIPFPTYIQNVYQLVSIIFIFSAVISLLAAYLMTAYLLAPLKQLARLALADDNNYENLSLEQGKGPIEIQQVTALVEKAIKQTRKVIQDRELILAGVSHDIRSPLACLRINTEWVEKETLRNEMIADIEMMDNIIDDFLNFMSAGQNEGVQTVNVPEFITALLHDAQRHDHDVKVIHCDDEMIELRPLSIKRLINNLISNAAKHASQPITLEAYRKDDKFQIWVCDRGDGIPEDQFEKLLTPFAQAEASRTKGGTGLGLAIAKRIADTHQGQLVIRNRKSGGLRVGIIFP